MECFAMSGEGVGRVTPHMGPGGLHASLAEVARVREELLITAREVKGGEERVLVRGRVYLRSRDLGICDMPAAWIWEVRGGRFVRGEVFIDLELAETRFEQISA